MVRYYFGYWRTSNWKPPIKRKKQRKYELQLEVYARKLDKWEKREPARWRLIAHFRWKCEKPVHPLDKEN